VQRYGLEAVLAHYSATSTILGKGSDELEAYKWPLDGKLYSAGRIPRINSTKLLNPRGLNFDPTLIHNPLPSPSTVATTVHSLHGCPGKS
jgi:hypothetical protein